MIFDVMTDYEKIMALPKPRPNRNRKTIKAVIGGVEVLIPPLPYRSTLPMARIQRVMRQIILEDRMAEKNKLEKVVPAAGSRLVKSKLKVKHRRA